MRTIVVFASLGALLSTAVWAGERREFSESFELDGMREVRVEFEVGELTIETAEIDTVEAEYRLRCKSRSSRCERYLERAEILSEERGERLEIYFGGITKTQANRMQIEGSVKLPVDVELTVDMGIGELEVSGVERDVYVDMGIGEVRLWLPERAVRSVSLDSGIGESGLWGPSEGVDSSRSFLIGSELEWEEGTGEADVVVDLGIGEISVHLE